MNGAAAIPVHRAVHEERAVHEGCAVHEGSLVENHDGSSLVENHDGSAVPGQSRGGPVEVDANNAQGSQHGAPLNIVRQDRGQLFFFLKLKL